MKAKDIKVGEHYRVEPYRGLEIKLLVDEVKKTERRRSWARTYGGDTRVFGRVVGPHTGKISAGRSDGYPLSKVIEPWDEARYLNLRRAQENQRAVDAEDAKLAELIIEALGQNGCHAEFRLGRGITIPRSSLGALLDLIRRP